jgi:hypothetical protein
MQPLWPELLPRVVGFLVNKRSTLSSQQSANAANSNGKWQFAQLKPAG